MYVRPPPPRSSHLSSSVWTRDRHPSNTIKACLGGEICLKFSIHQIYEVLYYYRNHLDDYATRMLVANATSTTSYMQGSSLGKVLAWVRYSSNECFFKKQGVPIYYLSQSLCKQLSNLRGSSLHRSLPCSSGVSLSPFFGSPLLALQALRRPGAHGDPRTKSTRSSRRAKPRLQHFDHCLHQESRSRLVLGTTLGGIASLSNLA